MDHAYLGPSFSDDEVSKLIESGLMKLCKNNAALNELATKANFAGAQRRLLRAATSWAGFKSAWSGDRAPSGIAPLSAIHVALT